MFNTYIHSYLEDLKSTVDSFDRGALERVATLFQRARDAGRMILIVGNGGSAAAASHMACDLGKGTIDFTNPGFRRFRTMSLVDNLALLTAIGNDLSYEDVFTEQLRAVLEPGDVVVLISASGNSPNLVKAADYAQSAGAVTVGILGFGGGRLGTMVDIPLIVSSRNYGIAEDFHQIVQHVLTQYLRRVLAGPPRPALFLDRDGVINTRPAPHTYVTRWEDFRLTDGAVTALRGFAELGFELLVVTNQQGVGKGLISADDLGRLHDRMRRELEGAGIRLAGVFACPHLDSDGCFCRKPRPGLLYRALNETPFLIDLERSFLIGDSVSDVQAGRAAGLATVFIGSPEDRQAAGATHVVEDLDQALALLRTISVACAATGTAR